MAANAESAVSRGALRQIYNGNNVDSPVFQCVQIKPLASQKDGEERFRCVLSDIDNFIQSMIITDLNHLINNDQLRRGTFVRLKTYQTNEVKGKRIMVIMDCQVLTELGEREKIGIPESLEPKEGAAAPAGGVKEEEQKYQPGGISSNNFYGSKPQVTSQKPAQPRTSGMNGAGTASYGNIYPIEALSPYAHRWTIKARCTNRSDIKTWHKQTSEGKLFSVNLMDESGEIRATGFNESVDNLYDLFHEDGVYYISSPCRVQIAKKQFSNLNNDYELTFERDTVVEKAEDPDSVPKVKYNFTSVGDLQSVQKDTTIDVIGVLQEVGEVQEITSKTTGNAYSKRELTLVDNTNYQVRLTIWGKTAQSFEAPVESVIAFKGVKVSDFGGRSLSLLSSGSMASDPDIDEAHRLKGWYEAGGRNDQYTSHASIMNTLPGAGSGGGKSNLKTIAMIRDEQIGMGEQADYFNLKATVVFVKSDSGFAYPACRSEGPPPCNKKVVEVDPGEWRCEKCDRVWDAPQYRYIMSVNVQDYTGQLWVSCFDEVGRQIMGATADEMMALKEQDDRLFSDRVQEANCQTWVFRCRAKMDTFQEQTRVRYQVQSVQPINFAAEANRLADVLKQYKLEDEQNLFVR